MQLTSLGEIIGERSFYAAHQPKRKIEVRIGKPLPFADASGYYCPYQILGAEDDSIRYAGGADSIQSIQLAMGVIGASLRTIEDEMSIQLKCVIDDQPDLGFPDLPGMPLRSH